VLFSFGSSAAPSRASCREGDLGVGVGAAEVEVEGEGDGDGLALVLGLVVADGVDSVLGSEVGSGSLVRLAAGSSSLLREQPVRTTPSNRATAATARSDGRFLVVGMASA
jgi:hypothetical protein